MVGIAFASRDWQIYLPIRHPEGNLPREAVLRYARYLLREAGIVVFANAPYDLDWLEELGLDPVNTIAKIHDIQLQEPLIDEERASYSLDSLSKQYLGRGKDEGGLRAAAAAYGVDPKSGLHGLPARFVGPYAEADVRLTFDVYVRQREILTAQGLLQISELEHDLLPIVFRMRQQGIPVDLDKVSRLEKQLQSEEDRLRLQIKQVYDVDLDEWSGQQIERVANRLGLAFPRTEKGNASFTGDFLSLADHPFFRLVDSLREVNRHRSVYLKEWFGANQLHGKIHPEWRQLASDEGGTRTGRMACSNPNAQQVPSRSKYGPDIRSCFIAGPGMKWAKLDYSQQEPRILVHYAVSRGFPGAQEVADAYRNDPKADIYQLMAQMANVTRKHSKTLTLGSMYGMGAQKLADELDMDVDSAKALRTSFNEKLPFVQKITEEISALASDRGWIKTLGGRFRHFNFFEPRDKKQSKGAKRHEQALEAYGQDIRRAFVHKALNSLIQGGAADMTKKAMVEIYQTLKVVPYMQVHDELDNPVPDAHVAGQIKEIMEHVYELKVPIVAELELGDHWK